MVVGGAIHIMMSCANFSLMEVTMFITVKAQIIWMMWPII